MFPVVLKIQYQKGGFMRNGLFIVIEGIDGCGKTTQINLLKQEYKDAVFVREPGGTAIGNDIRHLLFNNIDKIDPMTEVLLFIASRAELVNTVIKPNLSAGKIVIADRFTLSSEIYQGIALNKRKEIQQINNIVIDGLIPDRVFILGLAHRDYQARIKARNNEKDSIENKYSRVSKQLCEAYLDSGYSNLDLYEVVDALLPPKDVFKIISEYIASKKNKLIPFKCRV